MLGKIEVEEEGMKGWEWMDSITDAMDIRIGKLQEIVRDRSLAFGSPWYLIKLNTTWVARNKKVLVLIANIN